MKLLSVALPYILLVTFYTGQLRDFGMVKMGSVESSPYDGVAVPLTGAYETGKITAGDFASSVKRLKTGEHKDVWPWVYFNRFIGSEDGARSLSRESGTWPGCSPSAIRRSKTSRWRTWWIIRPLNGWREARSTERSSRQ